MLKVGSKRRRGYGELYQQKQRDEKENEYMDQLKKIGVEFRAKKVNIQDVPKVLEQNNQLVNYLKEKGMMTEEGQLKG